MAVPNKLLPIGRHAADDFHMADQGFATTDDTQASQKTVVWACKSADEQ
jgi:hypothetical protein